MRLKINLDDDRDYGGLFRIEHRSGYSKAVPEGSYEAGNEEKWVGQVLLGFLRRHICIGAKALSQFAETSEEPQDSSRRPGLFFSTYPDMNTISSALLLLSDLEHYYRVSDDLDSVYKTFIAVFPSEQPSSQDDFLHRKL